jgi:hypothetical protein
VSITRGVAHLAGDNPILASMLVSPAIGRMRARDWGEDCSAGSAAANDLAAGDGDGPVIGHYRVETPSGTEPIWIIRDARAEDGSFTTTALLPSEY